MTVGYRVTDDPISPDRRYAPIDRYGPTAGPERDGGDVVALTSEQRDLALSLDAAAAAPSPAAVDALAVALGRARQENSREDESAA